MISPDTVSIPLASDECPVCLSIIDGDEFIRWDSSDDESECTSCHAELSAENEEFDANDLDSRFGER